MGPTRCTMGTGAQASGDSRSTVCDRYVGTEPSRGAASSGLRLRALCALADRRRSADQRLGATGAPSVRQLAGHRPTCPQVAFTAHRTPGRPHNPITASGNPAPPCPLPPFNQILAGGGCPCPIARAPRRAGGARNVSRHDVVATVAEELRQPIAPGDLLHRRPPAIPCAEEIANDGVTDRNPRWSRSRITAHRSSGGN